LLNRVRAEIVLRIMAAAKEKGGTSSPTMESEPSIEDLLRSLNLKGEDNGGIFVAKSETESLKEGSKWMAVMKGLSGKPFSATSLKKNNALRMGAGS
jgi:hypothetical protein